MRRKAGVKRYTPSLHLVSYQDRESVYRVFKLKY